MRASDLGDDQRDYYEERAAIRQYHGGMSRDLAEREALADVKKRWQSVTQADLFLTGKPTVGKVTL
jgi:hypothetical protein